MQTIFGKLNDGREVTLYTIENDHIMMKVMNYGATLVSFINKDTGIDVVEGFESVTGYLNQTSYIGASIGRTANRIEKGKFTLNGKEYTLPLNNNGNCNHGGLEGFDKKIWNGVEEEDRVTFRYTSADGEEGYPGTLDFYAIYWLDESSLHIQYSGVSDKDTLINITNHGYFNLNGYASNIDDHTLRISASKFGCVDPDGLYTGELRDVKETAFDFNTEKRIGDSIHLEDEQLIIARGYDHPYVFDTKENQVCLYSPLSGIELKVSTTYPTAQIYSANYLDGQTDKYGKIMYPQDGLCIETSYIADSIHKEKNPSVLLKAGQVFEEETTYTFEVRK